MLVELVTPGFLEYSRVTNLVDDVCVRDGLPERDRNQRCWSVVDLAAVLCLGVQVVEQLWYLRSRSACLHGPQPGQQVHEPNR